MNIFLFGISGNMGKAILQAIESDPSFQLIGGYSRSQQQIDKIESADVILDFSSPEGTRIALKHALEKRKPLLIGTTGLSHSFQEEILEATQKIPIFLSPNFTIGIAFCSKMIRAIADEYSQFCSAEITEIHHTKKKDSPSGTALHLSRILNKKNPPPIHSVRQEGAVGTHKLSFTFQQEKIELKHEAFSREVFARGALIAVKFFLNKPPALYTMDQLISKRNLVEIK
ncbi:MAG: 4-hydroxy-tetrahydrodipicolinate reductase [Chlamydiae bacterium]|nr:4-hydroxy-tetrahydrodipicolinate reductase [Chlamydiota bacterium]